MTTTMTLSALTEFDQYCKDNSISKREGFARFDISSYTYYKSMRMIPLSTTKKTSTNKKATKKQETITKQGSSSKSNPTSKQGRFIPLEPASPPSASTICTHHNNQSSQSHLTIDINMGDGKEIRISGAVTTNVLREVLISLSNSTSHV